MPVTNHARKAAHHNGPKVMRNCILIVDDDRDFAESMEELLQSMGYSTFIAGSAEEARNAILGVRPQLALIDVRLGQDDGIALIPSIRRILPDTLCIVVTAFADMDTVVRALRAGAYDFLNKPLRMPQLTVLLEHTFERIALQRERARAIAQLGESEERFQSLVQSSFQGILVLHGERVAFANPALAAVFGYESPDDVLTTASVLDLFSPKAHARLQTLMAEVESKPGAAFSNEIFESVKKDGSPMWLDCSFRRFRWGDEQAILVVTVDVTERRRAEDERNRLAAAVEQAADCIFITDVEGRIRYVNPAFERVTGYPRAEALGKEPGALHVRQGNPAIDHDRSGTRDKPEVWRGRHHNRRKDGTEYHCETATSVFRDQDGNIAGFVEVQRDTTSEEKLQEQLRQAQKMEAIGVLAGGIAHDFNNLLTPILGFTEIAMSRYAPGQETFEDLIGVREAALRAKELVEQILIFSRKREPHRGPIDVRSLVGEVVRLLGSALPKSIQLVVRLPETPVTIAGDPGQLRQVIMNLCVNAHQAMPRGGRLSVAIESVELDGHETSAGDHLTGAFARLRVQDTGEGVTPDTLPHLFEPFFTTKRDGSGTGLGLAIVFGVVKSHDGYIDVRSEIGAGSAFDVYLPIGTLGALPSVEEYKHIHAAGTESVLLVDDEPMICEVGKKMLESVGYRVHTEVDPRVALEMVLANPAAFDLIITDQSMPDLPGDELIRKIRESGNRTRVIIASGYNDSITGDVERELKIFCSIDKPYSRDNLLTKVGEALGTIRAAAR